MAASSNLYSQSQLQAYGWRAFCIEYLCGIAAIAWYAVFLVDRVTLAVLTRLEGLASSPAGCPDYETAVDALGQAKFQPPQGPTQGLDPPAITSVVLGQMKRAVRKDRMTSVTCPESLC
jgi:hypothetical protein